MRIVNILILLLVSLSPIQLLADAKTVKIGASLPLSGALAKIGEDIKRGFLLAKEDLDSDKVKFEFIFEDDGFQGKNAATTALKLLDVDKVDIIISLWDMAEIIAPVAERYKTPHISFRWNPHVAEKFNYTMTFEATYMSFGDGFLELLKNQQVSSVYIIKQEIESWNLVYSHVKPKLQENGIKLLGESSFNEATTDINSILLKAVKSKPDQILFFTMPESLNNLLQKLKLLFPNQKYGGAFDEIQPNTLSLIENIPYISLKNIDPEFDIRFEAKFGEHIFARAAHAYDLTKLIKDYTTSTPVDIKLNKEELITYLNNVKNYKGVSGNLNSNSKRTIEGDYLRKVVKKLGDSYELQEYKP